MSQPVFKAPRPIAQIQQEYTNISCQAGQKQYQISVLKTDLDTLNVAMRDLNAEAFAVQEAEQKAKQEAEQKAKEEEAKKASESTGSESPKTEEVKNG